MSADTVSITFPDLSPAEASILAQEMATALAEDGVPPANITRQRASADAQDMGAVVLVAAGAYLWDLAQEAGKEFVKGAANRAGTRAMDAILRKWGTRAKVECAGKLAAIVGEQHRRIVAPRTIEQAQTLADLKSLGVVLLGSSTFPNYPAEKKLDNPAFKRSAELARQLFSPTYTVFSEAHVLDLFDQDLRADDIVDRIEDHVALHPEMRDVLIYYCGHGDYLSDGSESFYLTLKGTRPGRESATALIMRGFRQMVADKGALLARRCYFVLDCCFAAAAAKDVQFQGLDGALGAQLREILPSRGWAFLSAADPSSRAIGNDGGGLTMFTGALADVLTGQASGVPPRMSLGDLAEELAVYIQQRHPGYAVRPRCDAPRQTDGDVSRIPMFVTPSQQDFSTTKIASDSVEATTVSEIPPASARHAWAEVVNEIEAAKDSDHLRRIAKLLPGSLGRLAEDRITVLERDATAAGQFKVFVGDGREDRSVFAKPGENLPRDVSYAPEMVLVGPGQFWEHEGQYTPRYWTREAPETNENNSEMMDETVRVRALMVGPLLVCKYPVTIGEFNVRTQPHTQINAAGARKTLESTYEEWRSGGAVVDVSLDDAELYARWLSAMTGKVYRLLSEAEWAYCFDALAQRGPERGEALGQVRLDIAEWLSDIDDVTFSRYISRPRQDRAFHVTRGPHSERKARLSKNHVSRLGFRLARAL